VRAFWYEKKVCPVCGHEFDVKILRPGYGYKVVRVEMDYFPVVEGEHPVKYEVDMCPKCGYADFRNSFSKITPLDKKKMIPLLVKVPPRVKEIAARPDRDYSDAVEIHKVAYQLKVGLGREFEAGKIAHNIAWLYRLLGDKDTEREWLGIALSHYKKVIDGAARAPTREAFIKVLYLTAVIAYWLSEYDFAVTCLNAILKKKAEGWKIPNFIYKNIFEIWSKIRDYSNVKIDEEPEDSNEAAMSKLLDIYRDVEAKIGVAETKLPKDIKPIYGRVKRFISALIGYGIVQDVLENPFVLSEFLASMDVVLPFVMSGNVVVMGDPLWERFGSEDGERALLVVWSGEELPDIGDYKELMLVVIMGTEVEDFSLDGFETAADGRWFWNGQFVPCKIFVKRGGGQ